MIFFELSDGRLVNLSSILRFNPNLSNRIDYANGTHELLSEADAEAFKQAARPKTQRGRPAKSA